MHDFFFSNYYKPFIKQSFRAILYVNLAYSIAAGGYMDKNTAFDKLLKKRKKVLQEIEGLGDFRQGSLSPRYRKCGKNYCHCAKEGAQGHGPLWMVTRSVEGKTVSKAIPKEQVENTFEQIDTFHRFRELVREYTEANIRICDARLEEERQAPEGAKKKG